MYARVPCFRGYGHGGGREVLHLFQVEVQPFGDDRQFRHVFFGASGVAADEVGDELLAQVQFAVQAVEDAFEFVELLERGLAHDVQYPQACMFGCYLQASAYMFHDEFAGVFGGTPVYGGVFAFVQEQVVAHAASDKAFFDARHRVHAAVDVQQRAVVGVQVRADFRMHARGALAFPAEGLVRAVHGVHICRGASQVAQVSLEVGHLGNGFHFFQDALLAPAHDELALMCRDGAEGASSEAAAVEVYRKLNHIIRRDAFSFVFWVGQARVGQVERTVQFALRQGRIRRVDHHRPAACLLPDTCRFVFVRFFLDVAEVLCLLALVGKAFFVREEAHVGFRRAEVLAGDEVCRLWNIGRQYRHSFHAPAQFHDGFFAHAVYQQVGFRVNQDRRAHFVLPVVVMRQAAERGFDASQHDGHVGVQLFQDAGVDDARVFGAHVVASVGRIGVFAPQAFVGGVFVDHAVHASCAYAEEKPWLAQFLEVAQVVAPVGLGHDCHLQPFRFQDAPDNGGSERGVVDIGVAAEQDDVQPVPASQFHFFLGRGQPVGQLVVPQNQCLSIVFFS